MFPRWVSGLVLPLTVAISACGGGTSASAPPSSSAAASKPAAAAASSKPAAAQSGQPASAKAAAAVPFAVGYPAISANFTNFYVGVDEGIFRNNGLDVSLKLLRGSSSETQALVSGGVQSVISEANPALAAMAKGVDTVYVGNAANGLSMALVAEPSIKSVPELAGKSIGLLHVGALSDSAAHEVLPKLGLPLDKVKFQYLGDPATALAALLAGKVPAMVSSAPQMFEAEQKGYKILADFSKYPHVSNGVLVTQTFLKQHPDQVTNFLKGLIQANAYVKDPAHKAQVEDILTKRTSIAAGPVLDKSYRYAADSLLTDPTIKPGDLQDSIDWVKENSHATITFDRAVDLKLLTALEKSGFVKPRAD